MPNALHTASRVGKVGALLRLNIFVTVEQERPASSASRQSVQPPDFSRFLIRYCTSIFIVRLFYVYFQPLYGTIIVLIGRQTISFRGHKTVYIMPQIWHTPRIKRKEANMPEYRTFFEKLARDRNITVEEIKAIISARIETGMNAPLRRAQWEKIPHEGDWRMRQTGSGRNPDILMGKAHRDVKLQRIEEMKAFLQEQADTR